MVAIKLGEEGNIPIINFAPFIDGSEKPAVARAILESFKDVGFVYLVNHGLPEEKIKNMFEHSRSFFDLSAETKQLAPHPLSACHHRGYSAVGVEKVQHWEETLEEARAKTKRACVPDMKESFEVGRQDDEASPNIWLPGNILPGFEEACLEFYWSCNQTKSLILSALTLGLNLPETYFLEFHQAADNLLRLLHYPSVSTEALDKEEVVRIGAHSDFGSITLLIQDEVGGLEVEDPRRPGTFRTASPVKGSIIVNAGDFLMRWSNDLIKSTIHRVRAPPSASGLNGLTPDRYSLVYFCSADFTKKVECLPGTYSDSNSKKYEPISALEYVMARIAANY